MKERRKKSSKKTKIRRVIFPAGSKRSYIRISKITITNQDITRLPSQNV
jgi:hypothetical protein